MKKYLFTLLAMLLLATSSIAFARELPVGESMYEMEEPTAQAEPFIELFCRISYFRHFLGEEEIRGIAALKVMEFLMEYPDPPEDKEIPVLLKTHQESLPDG